MIKAVLLLGLAIAGLAILRRRNTQRSQTSASKKVLLAIFAAGFVVSVTFPDFTTTVANLLGVGRGADLVLYLMVLAFFFFVLNVYLKFRDSRFQLGELARSIAISEAAHEYRGSEHVLPRDGNDPRRACGDG